MIVFKILALTMSMMTAAILEAKQSALEEHPVIYVDNFFFNYLPTNNQKITLDKYMNLGLTSKIELRFRPRLFKVLNHQADYSDESSYVTPKDTIFKLKYYLMKPSQEIDYDQFNLKDYKLITAGESDARVVSSFARSHLEVNYDFTDLKSLEKKVVMVIIAELMEDDHVYREVFAVPYAMFSKENAGDIYIGGDKNQLIDDLCHEKTVFDTQKSKKLSSPFNSYTKALVAETEQSGKKLLIGNIKKSSSSQLDKILAKILNSQNQFSKDDKKLLCMKLLDSKVEKNFLGYEISVDERLNNCIKKFDEAVQIKQVKIIDEVLNTPQKAESFHGNLENLVSKRMEITVEESTSTGSQLNASAGFNLSAEVPFSKAISFGSVSGGVNGSVSGELYVNQSKVQSRSESTHVAMSETAQLNFEYRKVGLVFNANLRSCILITMDNFKFQDLYTSWASDAMIDQRKEVILNSKNNFLYCTDLVSNKVKETWFFIKKSDMNTSHLFDAESSEVNENMMELIRGEKNFKWLKGYLAQASSLFLVAGPAKADYLSPVIHKFFPQDEISQAKKSVMSNSFPGVIEL